jgi:beta-glucanase (GH16 family)
MLGSTGAKDFAFGGSAVQVGEQLLPAGFKVVVKESFDTGKGLFGHSWGPGVDTSIKGLLTIRSTADDQDSGAMVRPAGAEKGFGYGLYSFTLDTEGHIGAYALLWPSTDKWPGPEMDVLEIHKDGTPYSTVHRKNADGKDAFTSYNMNGVDETQVHTYSLLWEEGRLTGFVDGKQIWTTTVNVPKDFAHGGENAAPGIGVQTHWNGGALDGKNWITAYEFSYAQHSPLG